MKSSKLWFRIKTSFRIKICLVLVILVGFFLRVWRVGSYPPLLWDEAALGYNAYSVLETGGDEYGKPLPLIFKSFGDYKPGLYVYLALPFVGVLSLSQWSVRLPSVILGTLLPLVFYFLVKEILSGKEEGEKLALFSAGVLAFLPWAIHFSRGAWEVNIMTFFLVLGSWLWIKRLKKWSLFVFLLALWTYQGAKMMVPLILFGTILFLRNFQIPNFKFQTKFKSKISIFKQFNILAIRIWRSLGIWCLVFGILTFVWYWQSFSGPAKNRLKVMSLFSYRRPESEVARVLKEDHLSKKNWHFYLFHSDSLYYLRGFFTRYFNYFSPRFLAFAGDWNGPRHSAPYFGVIGHVNFVLFLIGLAFFLSQRHKFLGYFFLYWLLTAPLPAALSRDIISGVRALPMIIPLAFFIANGIYFLSCLKLKKGKQLLVLGILLSFGLDFIYWGDLYFVHMVKRRPKDWLYGYKEAVNFLKDKKINTNKIIFTDFYGQPYVYYLFYTRYPPRKYQAGASLIENKFGDVGRVERLDNIFFKPINKGEIDNCSNCLFIFSQDEIIRSGIDREKKLFSSFKPLGVIGGKANFYAYQTKE